MEDTGSGIAESVCIESASSSDSKSSEEEEWVNHQGPTGKTTTVFICGFSMAHYIAPVALHFIV